MESAKNGKWIIPFKKFSMVRVKQQEDMIEYMYIQGDNLMKQEKKVF